MRVIAASDLHLEFGDLEVVNSNSAQVLILAGDILLAQDLHDHPLDTKLIQAEIMESLGPRQSLVVRFRDFLDRCSRQFQHVIYVAGNHEFYHGKWVQNIQDLRDECARYHNVHFLEQDTVTIDGVLFVGGTLWTNMNGMDPLTLHSVRDMMSDFGIIRNDNKGYRKLTPQDTVERHWETFNYIRTVLNQNLGMPTVVVGHHAPSKLSTHPRYANQTIMNGAYSSDLSELILDYPQILAWHHGHTHHVFKYQIGETWVLCNPRGYIGHETQAGLFKFRGYQIQDGRILIDHSEWDC
jgi:predicted phosphodiesterase